jgi:dissimilatory sulfite reductase (desulfoviridin) alpha/beta subunit
MSRDRDDPDVRRLMEHVLSLHAIEENEEIAEILLICEIIETWMQTFNKTEADAKKVYKKYGITAFLSALGKQRVAKILMDYRIINEKGELILL